MTMTTENSAASNVVDLAELNKLSLWVRVALDVPAAVRQGTLVPKLFIYDGCTRIELPLTDLDDRRRKLLADRIDPHCITETCNLRVIRFVMAYGNSGTRRRSSDPLVVVSPTPEGVWEAIEENER